MKTKLLITFVLFFACSSAYAQSFSWVKDYNVYYSSNPAMVSHELTTDGLGRNISARMDSLTLYFGDMYGVYIVECRDAQGNMVWSYRLDGKVLVQTIYGDANGNIFVGGSFIDNISLNGQDSLVNTMGGQNTNVFMVSLNTTGSLAWKRNVTLTDPDNYAIAGFRSDNQGNVWYGFTHFNDMHIIRLDASGNDTQDQYSATGRFFLGGFSFDPFGNLFVSGASDQGNVSFGTSSYSAPNSYNTFVARYSPDRLTAWAKFAADVTFQFTNVVTDNSGNAYVAGALMTETDFGTVHFNDPPWVYDIFVVKVDSTGNFLWGRQAPYSGTLTGDFQHASQSFLTCDPAGNVYVFGTQRGTLDWGNGVVISDTAISSDEAAVLCFDNAGNTSWGKSFGSAGGNYSQSMAMDNAGDIYVGTSTSSTANFDSIQITAASNTFFVAKIINPNSINGITAVHSSDEFVYPNPSAGLLNIPSAYLLSDLTVQDLSGRIVFISKAGTAKQLDLSSLSKGMYLLKFGKESSAEVMRWIKY